ncbi:MAG: hypothetical protein V2I54_12465 [Bacteroidales bacterium]|jgi:hypothetical protein|nr:hypothetical protein [Bacteroidales bacterium]
MLEMNKNIKIWNRENTAILLLLLLSVFAVYYLPFVLSVLLFFVVFFVFAFKSKKDYFWIAFFFILLDPPGNLFRTVEKFSFEQLPFIKVTSFQAVFFTEIIPFIYLLKALLKKRKNKFVFKNDFIFLFIYFLFVLIYTWINFEMYYGKYYQLLVILGYWSLLFSLSRLLSHSDIIKLDKLLFPFVFLALFLQIVGFFTGTELISFFNPEASKNIVSTSGGFEIYRIISNIVIVLYCFIKALFYYFSKTKIFPSRYLIIIIISSILSIFLSGTRGWIVGMFLSLFVLFFMFLQINFKIKRIASLLFAMLIILFTVSFTIPQVKNQLIKSYKRLTTIKYLLEGDPTAGGTLVRLTERRYPMEEAFKQKPYLGWGFSNTYFDFDDHHIGMLVILLNVGIIGLSVFVLFFLRWVYKIWKYSKSDYINQVLGNSLVVFAAGLIFIFTIHSTSHTMWGFYWPYESDRLLFVLLFVSLNAAIFYSNNNLNNQYKNWN